VQSTISRPTSTLFHALLKNETIPADQVEAARVRAGEAWKILDAQLTKTTT